jgi:hypothetical protein
MLRQFGPYEKTTRTINNYCFFTFFFNKIDGNHKDTYSLTSVRLRADLCSLTDRLELAYGPTCLGPSCPRAELSGTPPRTFHHSTLIDGNHKNTYSLTSVKSIGKRKKKNPYMINQNHIFFKKLLWSHFWIDFKIFYAKPFRILYIVIVYLLIMFIRVVFICS